ncbi:MAG: DUF2309 domain-containing protein [Magnetococcus sp. DMHC-8]
MSPVCTEAPLPMRQRLLDWVHHLEHHLPGQAPLRDFIHHNTLHGFQHLPFAEALRQAKRVTGIHGYWPAEQFRAAFRRGRITWPDLEEALLRHPELAAGEVLAELPHGTVRRLDLYRVALLHDLRPLQASQLAWQRTGRRALSTWQPDLDETVRRQWLAAATGGEAEAVADLWRACLAGLGLTDGTPHPEEQLDDLLDFFVPDAGHGADLDERLFSTLVRGEADTLMDRLLARLGPELTLSGLLAALTGEDLFDDVRPLLLRHVAGYLDHGLAAWPYPDRALGFFAAWRRQAMQDWSFLPEELVNWREEIDSLGDDAVEAIMALLSRLGLPEKQWMAYLERLALRLPGWSGMIMWRHRHPGYAGLSPERVDVLDYLAVSLVLERLYAMRLCSRLWQVEPRLEMLRWYFRSHGAEFLVRWSLFNDPLPEHMAAYAGRLLAQPDDDPPDEAHWYVLARMLRIGRHAAGGRGGHTPHGHAWPLFLLAQHLGVTAQAWRTWNTAQVERVLDALACLDEDRAGLIWLQAYESHYRHQVFNAIVQNQGRGRWARRDRRPAAQLIFCMDEREEGFRRHLEELDPRLETLGAAGFFGVPIHWQGLDDPGYAALCPVVVTPAHRVREEPLAEAEPLHRAHVTRRQYRQLLREQLHQGTRLGLFRPVLWTLLAAPWAVLLLLGKLLAPLTTGGLVVRLRDWFDRSVPTRLTLTAPADAPPATVAQPRIGLTDGEQADRVEGLLRTIGLTDRLAPLVVVMGHGSLSQNNPHLAAYDCGACSGRHGGPNARVFAAMANRPAVREVLRSRGIDIPDDTWFLGAEHNTGSEAITWFDLALLPGSQRDALTRLQAQLAQAQAGSAHERSRRLASAPRQPTPAQALAHVAGRTHDFSQARPELGHVTNAVALIGRRAVVQGLFFDRRMFLISYDPTQDPEGRIAENILLAAGPVGAGISLEYYFSTVDNDRFGCGSKIMHNVTGLLGVMDGAASDLRTGLPKQMIEIHEAMRLLVIVEQTPAVLTRIHARQPAIRELVDNAWITLAAKEPASERLHLFRPGEGWVLWAGPLQPLETVARSADWYSGHDGPLPPVFIAQSAEVECHG